MDEPAASHRTDLPRRVFLAGSAVSTAAVATGLATDQAAAQLSPGGQERPPALVSSNATPAEVEANQVDVLLRVNGRAYPLRLDPRATLLDTLRERLGLTGTKKGCDRGQCGACTVHIDGRRKLSCLTLAAGVNEKAISTIEGLGEGDRLHPMQQAFLDNDGYQCGYCTPGQIMSAVALVEEGRARSDEEIAEFMSGNLCRCGAYENIRAAIRAYVNGGR